MTGAQSRHAPAIFSAMPAMTSTTTSALSGAANAGVSAGTALSRSKTAGMTVTGISMTTVPETDGVSTRWKSDNWAESRIGTNDAIRTRIAISAGPPSATAVTQTAMKAPEAPITSTWPEPMRPARKACRIVVAPQIATVANTAHER